MANQSQPTSLNDLNTTAFSFAIQGQKALNFFVFTANLPGLELARVDQASPVGTVNHAGDHRYEELVVEFMVDSELQSWKEIYDWMKSAGNFGDQEDYDPENIRKDGVLTLTSNAGNANIVVKLWGLIPTALSGINFDSRDSSASVVSATVTFAYMKYDLEIVS